VIQLLHEKHILLGVTGSISAYKACLVLRQLQSAGAHVKVVMTKAAQQFIGRMTFEALTQQEVMTDLFPEQRMMSTEHIQINEWADLLLICPATANCIGKISSGIADDFLTTTILAARAPVVLAPAMDAYMFKNPIFQLNCDHLRDLGYHILDTESGYLASGLQGQGRLADPKDIIDVVKKILSELKHLHGKKVLISAGPTREYIDAVRYISNPSSGKMGIALAEEAYLRGADVTLICGPTRETVIKGITIVRVDSAKQMADAVFSHWDDQDLLVMAAAVADYAPNKIHSGKMKKTEENFILELRRTEDIVEKAARSKGERLVVGFALESDSGIDCAIEKLHKKHLDLICLNRIDNTNVVFGSDKNQLTLIDQLEHIEDLPEMFKKEAAERIWDKVESLMNHS